MKRMLVLVLAVLLLAGCGTTEIVDRGERAAASAVIPEPIETQPPVTSGSKEPENADYILNTSSHKFHRPECSGVKEMKEKNKEFFSGDRIEVIERGYAPCQNCKP